MSVPRFLQCGCAGVQSNSVQHTGVQQVGVCVLLCVQSVYGVLWCVGPELYVFITLPATERRGGGRSSSVCLWSRRVAAACH